MTGATYNGMTYDDAANRQFDLDDGYEYLLKAIQALTDAGYDTEIFTDELDGIRDQILKMSFIMAKTKQLEDDAGFRLGGDLS